MFAAELFNALLPLLAQKADAEVLLKTMDEEFMVLFLQVRFSFYVTLMENELQSHYHNYNYDIYIICLIHYNSSAPQRRVLLQ